MTKKKTLWRQVSISAQDRLHPNLQLQCYLDILAQKFVSRVLLSASADKFKPTIPTQTRVRKAVSGKQPLVANTFPENNTVTVGDKGLLAIT